MGRDMLVARLEPLIEADVADEMMGLSIDRGLCFGFNATAAELWRMIKMPRTFGTLCDAMMAQHDVDRTTCAADLAAALREMADQGLVALTPAR